ncbi:MAG: hypothetical protein DDT37_00623 [Firmicutes bacterium]|nr:hypothetical protein [candidate division NPL-UPA2 bacterium]
MELTTILLFLAVIVEQVVGIIKSAFPVSLTADH